MADAETRLANAARALEAEGARTRAFAAALSDADAALVVFDDWTVKDVLGHVGASFHGMLRRMQGNAPASAQGRTLAELNEDRRRMRADWPLARVMEDVEEGRAALLAYVEGLDEAEATRSVAMTSYSALLWRVAWLASSHERQHRDEAARALGRAAPGGRVAWLNVSNGGVPKLPIFSTQLGELGLDGDAHRNPRHGGPTAALCLFSLEVIQRLQREGHPIYPGAIGENVTVAGLDWADIKPGDRLGIGPTLVEITRYTTPCVNIKEAFVGQDFDRVLAAKHPGEARAYARVIEGGLVTVGDPVAYKRT